MITYSVTDIFRQPSTLTSTDSGSCFLSEADLAVGNQTGQMESTKANRTDLRIAPCVRARRVASSIRCALLWVRHGAQSGIVGLRAPAAGRRTILGTR